MQLPLEFMAVPAIVSISALIGRKINIHPLQNDDWTVVPNLWGMLVAEPGSMKSPVIARIMEPIYNLEKQARNHFKKETKELVKKEKELALEMQSLTQAMKMDWNSAMGSEVARKKELIREINQLQENKIKHKRYITNDTTIEKLAMIMEDNPQGILLLRDELSGWLEGLSKSGREGSREFYLEAWNGNGTFSIDRVGRESTYVESMSLAIFGGIQPEKLQKYIARYEADHGQDGFLDRFQLCIYPEISKEWKLVDKSANKEAFKKITDFYGFLDKLDFDLKNIITLRFSSSAQEIANYWREGLELRLRNEDMSPVKKSYLGKYRSLMPSLALIFQVLESGHTHLDVEEKSTKLAIDWCDFLESHMDRILGDNIFKSSSKDHLLEKIKLGEIIDGDSVRNIYRKHWKDLETAEKVTEALRELENFGYLRIVKGNNFGRSSETILLNPSLGGAL